MAKTANQKMLETLNKKISSVPMNPFHVFFI